MAKTLADRMRGRVVNADAWTKGFGGAKIAHAAERGASVTFDDIEVAASTEGAWLIDGLGRKLWVPKSIGAVEGRTLVLPIWWAKQEGLV